ncbi:PAS domain-containing protein [Haloarcula litorea]|uniref:PAS domain-containing protein n=1 Tax=Haloarcula litorea TaxID=3032579 RepID=UPI0023E765E9|nr:PAS domain-containing protein [Halomicroarcula sp. GDY20]
MALAVSGERNRELLRESLASFETVGADGSVPPETDVCLVDETRLEQLRDALGTWKDSEGAVYAPVLLLARDAGNPWRRYGDALGDTVDAIQPLPTSEQALRSQVEGLLETRSYSVTAQERLEQLERSERAMDGASIGISMADATDPELPLTYVNDGFVELTGYDRDEALGRNCRFLQGEGTDEATVDEIRAALEAEEPVSVEILNYRASGEPFWNALDIEPIRGPDGDVTHFLGFQRDITDRKTRTTLLEQYERIVQSIDDPVLVLDDEERIQYANRAAVAAFGPDQLVERELTAVFEPRDAAAVQSALADVADTGGPESFELALDTLGRGRAVFQFRAQRADFESEGLARRVILVGRDISDIAEHQNRLSVLDRVLRHNIRNKMTVVAGTADHITRVAEEISADELRELASRIEVAATDLLDISDAARQFNRSIDPTETDSHPSDLAAVAEEVAAHARATYPDVPVAVSAPETARGRCPGTIHACVEQLVERAIERGSDEGGITIAVAGPSDEDTVELTVRTATGNLSDIEQRVLQRGSERQLDHAPGVELWLVKWAVDNSGGRMDVVDDGSGIRLTFPSAD